MGPSIHNCLIGKFPVCFFFRASLIFTSPTQFFCAPIGDTLWVHFILVSTAANRAAPSVLPFSLNFGKVLGLKFDTLQIGVVIARICSYIARKVPVYTR